MCSKYQLVKWVQKTLNTACFVCFLFRWKTLPNLGVELVVSAWRLYVFLFLVPTNLCLLFFTPGTSTGRRSRCGSRSSVASNRRGRSKREGVRERCKNLSSDCSGPRSASRTVHPEPSMSFEQRGVIWNNNKSAITDLMI